MTKFTISLRAIAALLPITCQAAETKFEALKYLRLEISHTHYRLVACDNLILALYREAAVGAEPGVYHLHQDQVRALLSLLPHGDNGLVCLDDAGEARGSADCAVSKDRLRFSGYFGEISFKLKEIAYPAYWRVIPENYAETSRVRFSYAGRILDRIAALYDMLGCPGAVLGRFVHEEAERKGDLFYCTDTPSTFQITVLAMGINIDQNKTIPDFWLPQKAECFDIKSCEADIAGGFGVLGNRSILSGDDFN